jgi:hypothetical protein
MDCDLWVLRGEIEENPEEISSVALLSPACFQPFCYFVWKWLCECSRSWLLQTFSEKQKTKQKAELFTIRELLTRQNTQMLLAYEIISTPFHTMVLLFHSPYISYFLGLRRKVQHNLNISTSYANNGHILIGWEIYSSTQVCIYTDILCKGVLSVKQSSQRWMNHNAISWGIMHFLVLLFVPCPLVCPGCHRVTWYCCYIYITRLPGAVPQPLLKNYIVWGCSIFFLWGVGV